MNHAATDSPPHLMVRGDGDQTQAILRIIRSRGARFDVAVKWRQLVSANDSVWWIDQLGRWDDKDQNH